jgi:nucleoporin GLE1
MASPSRRAQQAEFTLVLHRSQRSLYDRLDFEAAERAKAHDLELSQAAIKHESVLRGAQLERERLRLQEEHEKKEREEQQLRENERLRQLTIEAQKRTEEAARKAAEQQKQLQEAEARLKAQKEQAEAAQKQQQQLQVAQRVAAAKAREEAAAAEKLRAQQSQQPQQPPQAPQAPRIPPTVAQTPPATRPQPVTSRQPANTEVELIHSKYLELHRRMKAFRTSFAKQHANKQSPLKAVVGDMRRAMRLRMGQVTVDRKASVAAIAKMREEVFDKAKNTPGPVIDIRQFVISHPIPALSNEADARYPALLLYAFCVFTKSLLKQFEAEAAGDDGRIIQEMGLIAASLLADQKYMWNGIPMTDIVMAKYHNACPILFGLRATMDTPEGQARLGWKKIHGEDPQVSIYHQYMTGLGCGFAALSLRQFSGKTPAIPMAEYWRALASICNTPSENLYGGHFKVLQGLLRDYAKKFLLFYGAQARGVLRKATVDLPARAPPRAVDTANLVAVLKDGWLKNEKISLE